MDSREEADAPGALEPLQAFDRAVERVSHAWDIWDRAYCTPEGEAPLSPEMQAVAPMFFQYTGFALLNLVVLDLCRLGGDPLTSGRGKRQRDNLNIEAAFREVDFGGMDSHRELAMEQKEMFVKIVCEDGLIPLRNRVLAHHDLLTATGAERLSDLLISSLGEAVYHLRYFWAVIDSARNRRCLDVLAADLPPQVTPAAQAAEGLLDALRKIQGLNE